MTKYQTPGRALALLPVLLLAACGGGGGGEAPAPGAQAVSQVVITDGNAQPVAAEALQTSGTNGLAATGTALVTGVQVDAGAETSAPLQIAAAARRLLAIAPTAPALATAATASQTAACSGGGTISVSASVANTAQLSAGDQLSITANACSEVVDGSSERLDGTISISIAVLAGPFVPGSTVFPQNVQMRIVAQHFSLAQGGQTTVSDGDLQIGLVRNSATASTTTLSATALSSTVTTSSGTRVATLRNYSQKVDQASTGSRVEVSANVETNSSRLGTGTVAYTLATPTALTLNANGAYTGGSVKVTGQASALLLTVTGTDTFSLQVDANGDGTFESSRAVTRAQLKALL